MSNRDATLQKLFFKKLHFFVDKRFGKL